jgi:hypothetical protein
MLALEEALMRQGGRNRGMGGVRATRTQRRRKIFGVLVIVALGPSRLPVSMVGKIGSGSARIGSSGVSSELESFHTERIVNVKLVQFRVES